MKGEEIVQEGVNEYGLEIVSFHRFDDSGESPQGYGEAKREVLEHLAVIVYGKGQELLEPPVDGDMVKCVQEVECATPKGSHYPQSDQDCPFEKDSFLRSLFNLLRLRRSVPVLFWTTKRRA